jgi:hypothetical protein
MDSTGSLGSRSRSPVKPLADVSGEAAGGHLLYRASALRRGVIQGVENVARTARAAQRCVALGKKDLRHNVHLVEGLYGAVALVNEYGALLGYAREAP